MNNRLKIALEQGQQTIGTWITISHPLIPEILSSAGFDWLVVDMEHSAIELHDLLPLIISIQSCGLTALVRVGENNPNLIKRVMDIGADGIIVANIKSAYEAAKAVSAVRYPPEGMRGVGLYRAQRFGEAFDDYKEWLKKSSVVIIQIEHIDAVNNIDEILSTSGIDAFMIGPYDLSGSLGKPGELDAPEVEAALKIVLSAAERHQVPAGYHTVASCPKLAEKKAREGYRFLAFGVDSIFMGDNVRGAMKTLKEAL